MRSFYLPAILSLIIVGNVSAYRDGASVASNSPSSAVVMVAERFGRSMGDDGMVATTNHADSTHQQAPGTGQGRPAVSANFQRRQASMGTTISANQEMPLDVLGVLNMGGMPLATMLKSTMPGMYNGINTDLTNTMPSLSNGVQSQFKNLQSNYNSMSDSVSNQYNNGQDTIRRLYNMMSNPQQMCNQLATQTQSLGSQTGLQTQASQGMNQLGQTLDSYTSDMNANANLQLKMPSVSQATQTSGNSFFRGFGK